MLRWIVGSDPTRNGPWSGMNVVVISLNIEQGILNDEV